MNKLEINLKAAKMLGYEEWHVDSLYVHIVTGGKCTRQFDMFIHPSDTLAVVKMLGEKPNPLSIVNMASLNEDAPRWTYGLLWRTNVKCGFDKYFDTYEEAVGAAVEAV